METWFRSLILLLCMAIAGSSGILNVVVLSSKSNVDFSVAGNNEKIGSFLILNPAATSQITLYIQFSNDCNVEHFRQSQLRIPLQNVTISVNGVPQVALWTRGTDCSSVLSWTSSGAVQAQYQVDLSISWNAVPMNIAGLYSESFSINAITP